MANRFFAPILFIIILAMAVDCDQKFFKFINANDLLISQTGIANSVVLHNVNEVTKDDDKTFVKQLLHQAGLAGCSIDLLVRLESQTNVATDKPQHAPLLVMFDTPNCHSSMIRDVTKTKISHVQGWSVLVITSAHDELSKVAKLFTEA